MDYLPCRFQHTWRLCLSLALALLFLSLAWITIAQAQQPGDLDPTFNNGTGIVTTTITGYDGGFGMTIQPDGKIVVVGLSSSEFAIIRYTPDGSRDATFNNTGIVTTLLGGSWAWDVALQSDGRILVAGEEYEGGNADFVVTRYTISGSLDMTFNDTGIVTTDLGALYDFGHAIAILLNSEIVVAGESYQTYPETNRSIGVVRYDNDGNRDTTFNTTGIVTTSVGEGSAGHSVAIQPDGKIVVAGSDDNNIAVVRYTITGSLDTGFNGTGIVTAANGSGGSVAIQTDNKIVVVGGTGGATGDFILLRYNEDGSPDNTFNDDGVVTTTLSPHGDFALSVVIQSDAKIVVAGYSDFINSQSGNFAIVRYNPDGSLDTSFHRSGIVTTSISNGEDVACSVAIQPDDGKIVAAGYSCGTDACAFAVARYVVTGSTYLPVVLKE